MTALDARHAARRPNLPARILLAVALVALVAALFAAGTGVAVAKVTTAPTVPACAHTASGWFDSSCVDVSSVDLRNMLAL